MNEDQFDAPLELIEVNVKITSEGYEVDKPTVCIKRPTAISWTIEPGSDAYFETQNPISTDKVEIKVIGCNRRTLVVTALYKARQHPIPYDLVIGGIPQGRPNPIIENE